MKLDPWLHRMPVTSRWCADVITNVLMWDTQVSMGQQEGAMPLPLATSLQRVRDSLLKASRRAEVAEAKSDEMGWATDVSGYEPPGQGWEAGCTAYVGCDASHHITGCPESKKEGQDANGE